MDLDNEENYFTRRQNGAIKDKDVEKAIDIVKSFVDGSFCKSCYYLNDNNINCCECGDKAFETVMNELKYREAEIEKDNNIISDLQNEVTIKQCEIDKKEHIINLMADRLKHIVFVDKDNKLFIPSNKNEAIKYFTKKVEEE